MSKKKKTRKDPFLDLSWDDLNIWATSRIASRGRSYQRQGLVSGLARTQDGSLVAWVDGTHRYATKVLMMDGLPSSVCSCPYEYECKHAVATVLEYLERAKNDKSVRHVGDGDERLMLLADEDRKHDWDEEEDEPDELTNPLEPELRAFLQKKTKKELVEQLLVIAIRHPEVGQDFMDRKHMASGDSHAMFARLRREIQNFSAEPDWQYGNETSDYLQMADKLDMLLKAGHADEVLTLGQDLMVAAIGQIEMGFEEVDIDLDDCMPIFIKALDQSSLQPEHRLGWVIDAILDDDYSLFEALGEYLEKRHAKATWSLLVDQLLTRLKATEVTKNDDDSHRNYVRDQLANWIIYALGAAGRSDEIIPLCEVEARKTHSYVRLVQRLIEAKRYQDAQQWIQEGIDATQGKWRGVASDLRSALRTIHAKQKDWKTVAALQVQEFVLRPSAQAFKDCQKTATQVKLWSKVRPTLLTYLKEGRLPWKRKDWPLPTTDFSASQANQRNRFPMLSELIDIAILEKKPDQVLHWYERRPKKGFGGIGIREDTIATAIQNHAPDRAVAMWQQMAEALIAQTKPRAYEEAARYLRKAGAVMAKKKKKGQWTQYLQTLRQVHTRKRRFLEILDGLNGEPIINTN